MRKMGTYAVVKSGVIVNVIVWDGVSEWSPPEGTTIVKTDTAGIGWLWDGETFYNPMPPEQPPYDPMPPEQPPV